MIHTPRFLRAVRIGQTMLVLGGLLWLGGCGTDAPEARPARYTPIGKRAVPPFLQGTILELVDVKNTDVYPVSGYGLVVNLAGTGGNRGVPSTVRDYMADEMYRRGIGTRNPIDEGFQGVTPERMLDDAKKRTAIVTVVGLIPPGAREGQPIDLQVVALQDSETSSLAHGTLYRTSLRIGGANPFSPRGSVNMYAMGEGPVFVNPAHIAGAAATGGTAKASLRSGVVMGGAVVTSDRPLFLYLRVPEGRLSQAVGGRINLQYPKENGDPVARPRDEGIVDVVVPYSFRGDWERFAEVVRHLFLDGTSEFAAVKAKELVIEAQKPNAPLLDISYCWEGLGKPALDYIPSLYAHPAADVSFAAARAGAFLGDPAAQERLLDIGQQNGGAFQLNAVKALGNLPPTPRIDRMLGQLLDANNSLIRIEAYKILAAHQDQSRIISQTMKQGFIFDRVISDGPPMIYASRVGMPRLAIFGKNQAVKLPIMFTALESRFTISSDEINKRSLTVTYNAPSMAKPVIAKAPPDVYSMVMTLGGAQSGFPFNYADIVAVLQSMSDQRHIDAMFVLQDLPGGRDRIDEAPVIPDRGAPAANSITTQPGSPAVLGPNIEIRP